MARPDKRAVCTLTLLENGEWVLDPAPGVKAKAGVSLSRNKREEILRKIQTVTAIKTQGSTCWYCLLPDGTLWLLCLP
jgi:hypothetical protein